MSCGHITRNEPASRACAILPRQFWVLARAVCLLEDKTGSPCRVCPCSPPPDQLSQWARGGLSVVSLGHALTFQSLAKLALANNSNYTNRKGTSKPPQNHTVHSVLFGDSVPTLSATYTTRDPILSDRQAARVGSSPGSLRRPSAVIQKERWCWFDSREGHCLWPCHRSQTLSRQDTLG